MSGIATAIAGTAVLGYIGGQKAGDAAATGARDSAAIQAQTAEKNIDFQKWVWGEQKELSQPYADAGERALGDYESQVSQPYTMDDLYLDPGYQFGLNEGTKARENSASARGMQLSGRQQKDLTRFGTDYASTKFNEAFNRRQTGLDNLYRMINSGQAAAAGQAAQGGQMGNQVSSSINTAGTAASNAAMNIGNINAATAMAPYNTLMDIGGLAATYYGAKAGAR